MALLDVTEWLLDEDLLLQLAIEECRLDIHMMHTPILCTHGMSVDISYAQEDNSASIRNIVLVLHPRVFQSIVFILREAMV